MDTIINNLEYFITLFVVFLAPLVLGMYLAIRIVNHRHAERMAMIEQGLMPPQKKIDMEARKNKRLLYGFVFACTGLGIVISSIIFNYVDLNVNAELILVAFILLFMGLGFLAHHLFTGKNIRPKDL